MTGDRDKTTVKPKTAITGSMIRKRDRVCFPDGRRLEAVSVSMPTGLGVVLVRVDVGWPATVEIPAGEWVEVIR